MELITTERNDDAAPEPAPGPHKILVIDDEIGIRKGCRRVLVSEGHDVLLAETAEVGLALLEEQPDIEVALVDLRMPGIGGLEFLPRARALSPDLVLVVITAYATLDVAVEATKRDASDFLTKPFAPDALLRVVRKALERNHLIRETNRLREERERRLLELATEQSRLKTIIDSMADGVLVCNADQLLVLHNPASLRVLPGLGAAPKTPRLPDVLQPLELWEMISEAAESGKRLSRELELTHLAAGTWALADCSPVKDERTGASLGTVTVLRDITQMKHVEQVKAQFVNMVAHELRSPLAAVDSFLSILQRDLIAEPEERERVLGRCRERVGALVELVNDLLDVARMEAGNVRREIEPQQPAAVLAEVAELSRPLAEKRGIAVNLEVAEGLPTIDCDHEELIRVFCNLVSNAVKYNREGGKVTLRATAEAPYVRFAVSDTGVGISEKGLENLFQEFFREKRPETKMVTGTGLGLSIVKRIVDYYHGRIQAESVLDEGTTFTVWLPCRLQAEEE